MTDTQLINAAFWLCALALVLIFAKKRAFWPVTIVSAVFLALAFADFVL